jgi:hypothetical protein
LIRAKVRRFFRRCEPPGHHPQCANEPRLPCRGIAESAKPHEKGGRNSEANRAAFLLGSIVVVAYYQWLRTTSVIQQAFTTPIHFYSKHTPTHEPFKSPSRQARHRGLIPATRVLPGLVEFYVSEVTSLGLLHPSLYPMCPVPTRPYFPDCLKRQIRFQSIEPRSIDLPTDKGYSQFGTVSSETYWQALTGLSWLSYSRSCV